MTDAQPPTGQPAPWPGGGPSTPELLEWGGAALEWLARYLDGIEAHPVGPSVEPGWVRSQLPPLPPEAPESFESVLEDLDRIIVPGLTHWQSPNFFGYFPTNSSVPAVLGDLLATGMAVNGMLWATSPAVTELETHVLDWLAGLCGLPERFLSGEGGRGPGGGVLQDTASLSAVVTLVAARHRAGGNDELHRMCVYTSEQAHSSIEKGARMAGFRAANVRLVRSHLPTGDAGADEAAYAMDVDALAGLMAADADAGRIPAYVAATIGSTSSMAIDDVPAVAEVAARHGAWLHVDAAMAGSAFVCPEFQYLTAGFERADSFCFNPHKWLLTNFDCDALWVADRRHLIDAMSITPEYLRTKAGDAGEVIDYRDWQVQLGRRFRALKVWFVLRLYGAEGLRDHIRRHVELAEDAAARLVADGRWVLAAPVRFGLVCLRHVDGDERTRAVIDEVNRSGRALLTRTRLGGHDVLRISVGGTSTRRQHVDELVELLLERGRG